MPDAQRSSFLEQLRSSDTDVAAALEMLLQEVPSAEFDPDKPETVDYVSQADSADQHTTDYHPPVSADLPQRIGRYAIDSKLGEGGMGVVYRGRDPDLKRFLAVKVIKEGRQHDADLCRRFLDEAQIMGQLQHPGVAPIHEVGELDDGRPFFSMKQIQGQTLAELLKARENRGADVTRFIGIFAQVCQTLGYAHAQGIIHRDLKPANIMVGEFGEVQVMDWGLAKRVNSATTNSNSDVQFFRGGEPGIDSLRTHDGAVMGTPVYMAPEQARGEISELDERCDVFGLGGILCVILTSKPPFWATNAAAALVKARSGDLAEAHARLDTCGADHGLISICRHCLAPNRQDRPGHGGEVAKTIAAYDAQVQERTRQAEQDRAAALARAEEAKATAAAERRTRRLTVGLAVAALLFVVGSGVVTWAVYQQRVAALHRQEQANNQAQDRMDQARTLLEQGWHEFDVAKLNSAHSHAKRAVELATSASAAVQAEAQQLDSQVRARMAAADQHRTLLAALLDVYDPKETKNYIRGEGGAMLALARPSADAQFHKAFQRWGTDLDREPIDELVAKMQKLPEPVQLEIIAGLDGWAQKRRRNKLPEAKSCRLYNLADRLDTNPQRRQLRQLRVTRKVADHKDKLLKMAKDLDPLHEPMLGFITLARTLELAGEHSTAEKTLRDALAVRPHEVILLDRLAKFLMRQRPPQIAKAIECYRAARALRPQMGIALSDSLILTHRLTEAEQIARDLLRRQPDNPVMHFNLGNVLNKQKKFTEAIAKYQKATTLDPRDAAAYINWGVALDRKKDYDGAIVKYQKAIGLQERDANNYLGLGIALSGKGQFSQAIHAFTTGRKLLPKGHPFAAIAQQQIQRCLVFVALEKKLPDVLAKKISVSPQEQLNLALLCQRYKKRYRDAVNLWSQLFTKYPQVEENLSYQRRYHAACCGLLAASGQGIHAKQIDANEKTRLRKQALTWLKADVQAYRQIFKKNRFNAIAIADGIKHWRGDSNLESIREPKEIAKLPKAEQKAWRQLWSDVKSLQKTIHAAYTETQLKGTLTNAKREQSHPLKMTAGTTYVIDMQSQQFDTFLRLNDATGKKLAENDDIVNGKILNSRIVFTPKQDGIYRIIATSFGNTGQGAYEITIRAFAAEGKPAAIGKPPAPKNGAGKNKPKSK